MAERIVFRKLFRYIGTCIAVCTGLLLNHAKAQDSTITGQQLKEVIVQGERQPAIKFINQSIKLIRDNYPASAIPLRIHVAYKIYKIAAEPDFSVSGDFYWYGRHEHPLDYDAYIVPGSLVKISHPDRGLSIEDYLLHYNAYPYQNFGTALKKAYRGNNTADLQSYILPDYVDPVDSSAYRHVLLRRVQQAIGGPVYSAHYDDHTEAGITILSDFLIDKKSGAFHRIRYLFFPESTELEKYLTQIITKTGAQGQAEVDRLLSDEHYKLFYWEVVFRLYKGKWYPASNDVKNNFLFHPYIMGTGKERTVRFHYETQEVIEQLPQNLKRISFPEQLFSGD